jgi:hypothetical protein
MGDADEQRAEQAERTARVTRLRVAIDDFLAQMRAHGNPGAIAMLRSSPWSAPQQTRWPRLLGGTPPLPQTAEAWPIAEAAAGPDGLPVHLALCLDGTLWKARTEYPPRRDDEPAEAVWVLGAPFALGAGQPRTVDGHLEDDIPRGIGRALVEHGVASPGD